MFNLAFMLFGVSFSLYGHADARHLFACFILNKKLSENSNMNSTVHYNLRKF